MNPIVKIHGGQHKVKKWVISHFPRNYEKMRYLETCVGGGNIILNKNPSVREIICDIDLNLLNVYIETRDCPRKFSDALRSIPYTEESFTKALRGEFSKSVNEYVLRRMSRGGLMKNFAWSERLRGGKPGDENAWLNSIDNLSLISNRLKNVCICHNSILASLAQFAHNSDFIYIDPPFLPETRTAKKCYRFEMTPEDHEEMLIEVCDLTDNQKILIAGYANELYDDYLYSGWTREDLEVINHSSQAKVKNTRILSLWRNYT